jgi:hypothetical protein
MQFKGAVPLHAMEALCGERMYSSYLSSTPALDGGEWSAPRPGERTPGTHCTGGWVGLRGSMDAEARGKIFPPLPGIEPCSPGHPARSQTLYWLSHLAHNKCSLLHKININKSETIKYTKNIIKYVPWKWALLTIAGWKDRTVRQVIHLYS